MHARERGVGRAPVPLFCQRVGLPGLPGLPGLINRSSVPVGCGGVIEHAKVEVEDVQNAIGTGFPLSGGVSCAHPCET
jgi:hypothetical protein